MQNLIASNVYLKSEIKKQKSLNILQQEQITILKDESILLEGERQRFQAEVEQMTSTIQRLDQFIYGGCARGTLQKAIVMDPPPKKSNFTNHDTVRRLTTRSSISRAFTNKDHSISSKVSIHSKNGTQSKTFRNTKYHTSMNNNNKKVDKKVLNRRKKK